MRELDEAEVKRIEQRWKSDVDLKLDRVDSRVRIIERLVWVATGGVIVLSAVSVIGVTIISGFAAKLELVSSAQAVSNVEYRLRQDAMQQQIDYLRSRVR